MRIFQKTPSKDNKIKIRKKIPKMLETEINIRLSRFLQKQMNNPKFNPPGLIVLYQVMKQNMFF